MTSTRVEGLRRNLYPDQQGRTSNQSPCAFSSSTLGRGCVGLPDFVADLSEDGVDEAARYRDRGSDCDLAAAAARARAPAAPAKPAASAATAPDPAALPAAVPTASPRGGGTRGAARDGRDAARGSGLRDV